MTQRTHHGSYEKPKVTPVALAKRIEKWQGRLAHLGVSHFRITRVNLGDDVPGHPNGEAAVLVPDCYDSAEFWLTWDFLEDCDEYTLDVTIVHEWLHVAMRDFDRSLDNVESWMPRATYADFQDRMKHEREGLVERLARTIVGLYYDTDR